MSKQVEIEYEYEMSEEERTEKAKEGVRLTQDVNNAKEKFKDSRADWRRRIKDLEKLRDDANNAFLVGTEMRKVKADQEIDFPNKKAKYFLKGKLIKTRDIPPEELERMGTTPLHDEPENEIAEVIKEETSKTKKKDGVTK